MLNQTNTTPITQFVQAVKAAEQTNSKEVKLSIQQARSITLAMLELLDSVKQNYEQLYAELRRAGTQEVVQISMDGGGFDDK